MTGTGNACSGPGRVHCRPTYLLGLYHSTLQAHMIKASACPQAALLTWPGPTHEPRRRDMGVCALSRFRRVPEGPRRSPAERIPMAADAGKRDCSAGQQFSARPWASRRRTHALQCTGGPRLVQASLVAEAGSGQPMHGNRKAVRHTADSPASSFQENAHARRLVLHPADRHR
jgi:hypothetical protein